MTCILYTFVVDILMYAIVCIRSDIAHTIIDFLSNPGKEYSQILKYLKGTIDMDLYFGSCKIELVCYTYSNFGGNLDNSKSTSDYLITFIGAEISQQCRQYKCITISTTKLEYIYIFLEPQNNPQPLKFEYIANIEGAKKFLWTKEFVKYLDFERSKFILFCDNQSLFILPSTQLLILNPSILIESIIRLELSWKRNYWRLRRYTPMTIL